MTYTSPCPVTGVEEEAVSVIDHGDGREEATFVCEDHGQRWSVFYEDGDFVEREGHQ